MTLSLWSLFGTGGGTETGARGQEGEGSKLAGMGWSRDSREWEVNGWEVESNSFLHLFELTHVISLTKILFEM